MDVEIMLKRISRPSHASIVPWFALFAKKHSWFAELFVFCAEYFKQSFAEDCIVRKL
jgi:hypothetical protein